MLHTLVRGSGPSTAVLLHSTGLSSRQWGALTAELETTHRVLVPDLTGYGANPPFDDRPFAMADELAAIIELLPDEPVHLVGHSYGGVLALQLARLQPERVRSVGVYDPVAFGVLHEPDDAEGLSDLATIDGPAFRDVAEGGSAAWLQHFVDYWNRGPVWQTLPQSSRDAFVKVGRKAFREVMDVTDDKTSAIAYASIRAPTLILSGGSSPAAARRVAVLLAEALPNARLVVMPDMGHMAPVTDGTAINAALAEHVRAQS